MGELRCPRMEQITTMCFNALKVTSSAKESSSIIGASHDLLHCFIRKGRLLSVKHFPFADLHGFAICRPIVHKLNDGRHDFINRREIILRKLRPRFLRMQCSPYRTRQDTIDSYVLSHQLWAQRAHQSKDSMLRRRVQGEIGRCI